MFSDPYSLLLGLHRSAVTASVLLFCARGVGVLMQAGWPLARVWRRTSVVIDTLLLGGGAGLWLLLSHNPLREPWLATKLLLLPVYVVLGSFALRRAPTPRLRALAFAAALLVVASMIAIALTRQPLGWLAPSSLGYLPDTAHTDP